VQGTESIFCSIMSWTHQAIRSHVHVKNKHDIGWCRCDEKIRFWDTIIAMNKSFSFLQMYINKTTLSNLFHSEGFLFNIVISIAMRGMISTRIGPFPADSVFVNWVWSAWIYYSLLRFMTFLHTTAWKLPRIGWHCFEICFHSQRFAPKKTNFKPDYHMVDQMHRYHQFPIVFSWGRFNRLHEGPNAIRSPSRMHWSFFIYILYFTHKGMALVNAWCGSKILKNIYMFLFARGKNGLNLFNSRQIHDCMEQKDVINANFLYSLYMYNVFDT